MWFGKWRTADGKGTLNISSTKLSGTISADPSSKFLDRKTVFEYTWIDKSWEAGWAAPNSENLMKGRFAYSSETTNANTIRSNFEKVLADNEKNKTNRNKNDEELIRANGGIDMRDTPVVNPARTRQAIAALSNNNFQVIRSYRGGDMVDSYYWIFDNGKIIWIDESQYEYDLRVFERIK